MGLKTSPFIHLTLKAFGFHNFIYKLQHTGTFWGVIHLDNYVFFWRSDDCNLIKAVAWPCFLFYLTLQLLKNMLQIYEICMMRRSRTVAGLFPPNYGIIFKVVFLHKLLVFWICVELEKKSRSWLCALNFEAIYLITQQMSGDISWLKGVTACFCFIGELSKTKYGGNLFKKKRKQRRDIDGCTVLSTCFPSLHCRCAGTSTSQSARSQGCSSHRAFFHVP